MGEHAASKPFWRDALERIGWSAAEAAVATSLAVAVGWDYAWVPILVAALTVLKTQIAKYVGKPDAAIG